MGLDDGSVEYFMDGSRVVSLDVNFFGIYFEVLGAGSLGSQEESTREAQGTQFWAYFRGR